MNLNDLFKEADEIIEKTAAAKDADLELPAPVEVSDSEKFAHQILTGEAFVEPSVEMSDIEKVAHAAAVIDTMINADTINKVIEFEKAAAAKGISGENIRKFIAEKMDIESIVPGILLEGLDKEAGKLETAVRWGAVPAAALASLYTYKKGKKKGYDVALQDVNKAFQSYYGADQATGT